MSHSNYYTKYTQRTPLRQFGIHSYEYRHQQIYNPDDTFAEEYQPYDEEFGIDSHTPTTNPNHPQLKYQHQHEQAKQQLRFNPYPSPHKRPLKQTSSKYFEESHDSESSESEAESLDMSDIYLSQGSSDVDQNDDGKVSKKSFLLTDKKNVLHSKGDLKSKILGSSSFDLCVRYTSLFVSSI